MAESDGGGREKGGMKTKTLCLGALMTAAIPSMPAQAQQGTEVSAAKLVGIMELEGVLDTMFQQMTPMMTAQIMTALRQVPDAPADVKVRVADPSAGAQASAIMDEEIMRSLRKRYPEIMAATAKEYAATFSEADLQAAITSYETPAGRRFVQAQPKLQALLSRRGGAIGMAAGGEAVPAAIKRIRALPAPAVAK